MLRLGAVVLVGSIAAGIGCAPLRETQVKPLWTAARATPTQLDTVMVATQAPSVAVLTVGTGQLALSAPPDENGPGLVRALERSRVARQVVLAPIANVSSRELILAARQRRAQLLITSQVVGVRLSRGLNGIFAGLVACALTVGLTLVGIPACMAIPANTAGAEVELEVAIWHVAQARRVWQQRVRRTGWTTASTFTIRKAAPRAIRRGMNVAYRAAIPLLSRGVAQWAGVKAAPKPDSPQRP